MKGYSKWTVLCASFALLVSLSGQRALAACGDGIDDGPNEECDPGGMLYVDGNPAFGSCEEGGDCFFENSCCKFNCQFVGEGASCFDGNGCTTDDTCNQVGACIGDPDVGAACDDELFCTSDDRCDSAGACSGTSTPCDDGVGCTVDDCTEETQGCTNVPSDALCDDEAFCNGTELCDAEADCQPGTPPDCGEQLCDEGSDTCVDCLSSGDCDDGLYCNGAESCVELACVAGSAPDCDDGVGCTVDSCDESSDACSNVADDTACDDGFFCTGVETCDAEADCLAGTPVDCSDAVGCTDDDCDEGADACSNVPNDSLCDNDVFCDGLERCDEQLDCQPGLEQDCSELDGDCTEGRCDVALDTCVADPVNEGAECDDGDVCTTGESCVEGICAGGMTGLLGDACGWVIVGNDHREVKTQEDTRIVGDICMEEGDIGETSTNEGSIVATSDDRGGSKKGVRVIEFREGVDRDAVTIVSGDVATGGGGVRGKPPKTPLPGLICASLTDPTCKAVPPGQSAAKFDELGFPQGEYDATGTSSLVADCQAAQDAIFGAVPEQDVGIVDVLDSFVADVELGRVRAFTPLTITAVKPGINVVDIDSLQVENFSSLTLSAGGHADVVFILRVARKLQTKLDVQLVLDTGVVPENVLIYGRKQCRIGNHNRGAGTIICPNGVLRMQLQTEWDGALIGGKKKLIVGDEVVLQFVPFLGG